MKIPIDIKYDSDEFPALSNEELEKLKYFRPATLQEAGNIPGLTPAGVVYLFHFIRNYHEKKKEAK
jgi:tRNA U34 5-carboxymethylaminomethyl modifying enzyme MnmG/GidA